MKGSAIFSDVPKGSYYDDAVGEMYGLGVIKGYDGGKFGPNDYVTRGQVAVMMQRLRAELTGQVVTSSSSSRSSASSTSTSSSSTSVQQSNPHGLFRFTAATFSTDENAGTATITVIRSSGADDEASVEYAVTAGTATAEDDFEILSGELDFSDGESTKTIQIKIKDDSTSEGNETVNVTLSSPTGGAALGTPSTTVLTIRDNEASSTSTSSTTGGATSSVNSKGTLNFSALEYQIAENGGTLTVTVERSGGTTGEVGVAYATSHGTGNGTNYAATNGTLTFAAGDASKTFTVSITDNDTVNGSKTFNIALSAPTGGATLGTAKNTKVTISDDEVAPVGSGSFVMDDDSYSVLENGGSVQVIVKRIGGATGEKKVDYATVNGLAQAGYDFTATSGTLTFKSGEAQKIITIPILTDAMNDPGETFTVRLTGNGSTVGNPSEATVNIDQ